MANVEPRSGGMAALFGAKDEQAVATLTAAAAQFDTRLEVDTVAGFAVGDAITN